MGTATFIGHCSRKYFRGDARLYRVDPPIEYAKPWDQDDPPAKTADYVVVSATNAMFTGPETYIFPATKDWEVINWMELDGSFRGGYDHERALLGAGYHVVGG